MDWEALAAKKATPPFVPKQEANVQTNVSELFDDGGGACVLAAWVDRSINRAFLLHTGPREKGFLIRQA